MEVDHQNEEENGKPMLATLNTRQLDFLSQISQDIRATVSHLLLPKVSPLSVLNASATESLKDLYYALNTEDPLNSMPVRRHVLATNIPTECLLPIATASNADPAMSRNRKRWSLPMYQTLRLLSVLTLPISADCELATPAQLDYLLLDLRAQLADHRDTLSAFVSLLQYYIDRKAEKHAAMAPAEEAKVEDARIDNILRFFSNILSPPRPKSGEAILERDRAVHLALVGSLVKVEFFSTLAVLFSTAEDARTHYTDLVFLVANIYALAYRYTTPRQMIRALRENNVKKKEESAHTSGNASSDATPVDILNPPLNDPFEAEVRTENPLPVAKPIVKPSASNRGPNLRDALLRERAAIGGSRAISAGARWTSRHSGGFSKAVKKASGIQPPLHSHRTPNGVANIASKRVLSAKGAIAGNKGFNPKHSFQESMQVSSELLCQFAANRRSSVAKKMKSQTLPTIRRDLQDDGLNGLVSMTSEMIDVSFQYFVRELRSRIEETKERAQADETDALKNANRAFLSIVGSVVGFHRERCGKVYKREPEASADVGIVSSEVHQNNMKLILSSDFKIIKKSWKEVQAAIELESFQMVFSVLVSTCEEMRESGRDESILKMVELATFSVLEMMKMLQGMAAVVSQEIEESNEARQGDLTPRDIALNTLEKLFEREAFLNAPADLAKHFTAKLFSFQHLSNIVEMAHTFTTILLDEQELAKLQVAKKKKKRKVKKIIEEDDEEGKAAVNDKSVEEGDTKESQPPSAVTENVAKKNKDDAVRSGELSHDLVPEEGKKQGDDVANLKNRSDTEEKPKDMNSSGNDDVSAEVEGIMQAGKPTGSDVNGDFVTEEGHSQNSTKIKDLLLADEAGVLDNGNVSLDKGISKIDDGVTNIKDMLRADEAGVLDNGNISSDKGISQSNDGVTKIRDMLRADKEAGGIDNGNISLDKGISQSDDGVIKIEDMLRADEEAGGIDNENFVMDKGVTKVEKMLIADQRADIEGAPKVTYVTQLDGGEVNPGDDITDEEEEDADLSVREVESIGIVRRFAHSRAIETLLIPMRAAMCQAVDLSGKAFPVPEGCEAVITPIIVAKSAHVVGSIWKVAQRRERGWLCGQFFSFGVMQFLSIALTAQQDNVVKGASVLSQFCGLAKDVTDVFFKWLAINPGLMYDMFLLMDRSYTMSFAKQVNADQVQSPRKGSLKARRKQLRKKKSLATGEEENLKRPSSPELWNDDELDMDTDDQGEIKGAKSKSDSPNWGIEEDRDVDLDTLDIGNVVSSVNASTGKRKRRRRSSGLTRNTRMRANIIEDEDVDDLDALNFGEVDDEDKSDNEKGNDERKSGDEMGDDEEKGGNENNEKGNDEKKSGVGNGDDKDSSDDYDDIGDV